jgi:hypothetical protein
VKELLESARYKDRPELHIRYLKETKPDTIATPSGDLDPYTFATSVNINRRHLTAAQKRELVEMLLKVRPDRSDRATAKLAKVDDKTVASVRKKLEGTAGRRSPAAIQR